VARSGGASAARVRRTDPSSPFYIHARSGPLQHILLLQGVCARIIFSANIPLFGHPTPPFIAHSIAQFLGFPSTPCMENMYLAILEMALSCKARARRRAARRPGLRGVCSVLGLTRLRTTSFVCSVLSADFSSFRTTTCFSLFVYIHTHVYIYLHRITQQGTHTEIHRHRTTRQKAGDTVPRCLWGRVGDRTCVNIESTV